MKNKRGRRRNPRTLQRDFGQKREESYRRENAWLSEADFRNARFEAYYRKQGIVPDDEWDAFLEAARTELPVVFRINGRGPCAQSLRAKLETDFFSKLANAERDDGGAVAPPKALPWYPGSLAWQFDFSRRELRRDPTFEQLHEYIKHETSTGHISRQEAVSMIPPLVMDVQSHHRVLDMCAAPGSKTVQLLEMLHGDQTSLPTGFVVANDVDFQRCNMMTHQVKRMVSPNIFITSADASLFPSGIKVSPDREPLVEFDRILADVPCSGDGTTRKNPEVWRNWKLHDACGLHPLQLKIALRAVKLLAVGGQMVYSTCSLNPLEDEAVVAEVLRRSKGAMELLDLGPMLPELKSSRGKQTWIVQDDNREYGSYDEAVAHRAATQKKLDVDPSFFPPAEDEDLPLERCMRVLPHQNNSGGFFVALFKKLKAVEELPVPSVQHRIDACPQETKQTYQADRDKRLGKDKSAPSGAEPLGERQFFKGIDPIISLEEHSVAKEVREFYGLEGVDLDRNLISRNLNHDEPRKVYFISTGVRDLIRSGYDRAIRITSLGQQVLTRAFQRKSGTAYRCIYRFCQEGLPLVLPYVTRQKLYLKVELMQKFLKEKTIRIPNPNNEEAEAAVTVRDTEVVRKIGQMEQGGCIVLLDDADAAARGLPLSTEAGAGLTAHAPLAVSAWLISPFTLNLMVPKEETTNMLRRLEEVETGPEAQAPDIPTLRPESPSEDKATAAGDSGGSLDSFKRPRLNPDGDG